MITYTNECCGCATPGYPCVGETCELLHVVHYICDGCKHEVDKLYWYDGEQLCMDCIEEELEEVIPE